MPSDDVGRITDQSVGEQRLSPPANLSPCLPMMVSPGFPAAGPDRRNLSVTSAYRTFTLIACKFNGPARSPCKIGKVS